MGLLPPPHRRPWRACFVIGMGLGGFVDGIVLHQVLQVHHMASGVAGRGDDLRWNMMLDGLFHVLAWLLVVLGLFLLHAAWRQQPHQHDGHVLLGGLLAGWGAFHLIEGTVDHHLLGLHHTWPAGPGGALVWDLVFLASGALLLAVGILLGRRMKAPS